MREAEWEEERADLEAEAAAVRDKLHKVLSTLGIDPGSGLALTPVDADLLDARAAAPAPQPDGESATRPDEEAKSE